MDTDDLIKEIHADVRGIRKDLAEIATKTTETRVILDEHINRDSNLRKKAFILFSGLFCVIIGFLLKTYF